MQHKTIRPAALIRRLLLLWLIMPFAMALVVLNLAMLLLHAVLLVVVLLWQQLEVQHG